MCTIGERIRELKKHYKLNQTDFAKRIGISYGHVSNIETGKDNPSDSVLKLIIMEYGTNETWLKTGEGDMLDNSEYGDHITLNDSSAMIIQELSELLNNCPTSNKVIYVSILSSVLSLFKASSSLSDTERLDRLDITDEVLNKIANYDLLLQGLAHREYTDIEVKRVEKMQEDLFCELACALEAYKDIFLKENP